MGETGGARTVRKAFRSSPFFYRPDGSFQIEKATFKKILGRERPQ